MNKTILIRVVPACLALSCSLSALAETAQDWQEGRLLTPSSAHRQMEREGRVYIYDGLHEDTVNHALDTQFGRVENMMFVGIRYTADDGAEYVDDDCD